ncbi:MAG TPA: hypothetical protein VGH79_04380 [Gaiellaceae bacterium]
MIPILFVVFQLAVLVWAYIRQIGRQPDPVFKGLWIAAICGVIALDVWYFTDFAYRGGFVVI